MKRGIILLLLAALLLCGCQKKQKEITVDSEAKTVSDGKYTYTYKDVTTEKAIGTFRRITIYYPNGATYYRTHIESNGSVTCQPGEYTGPYDKGTYTDGETLINAIAPVIAQGNSGGIVIQPEPEKKTDPTDSFMTFFCGLALLGIGCWPAFAPESVWFGRFGWAYKDAEPSDRAIGLIQGSGILELIIGVIFIIVGVCSAM